MASKVVIISTIVMPGPMTINGCNDEIMVVMMMQLFLDSRGAQFPVPSYLFTIQGIYLQAVLQR